jgi:nicotinamidase/pyrazinamidase
MNTFPQPRNCGEVVAINVDVQNDFALPTGALAVEGGEAVIAPLNVTSEFVRRHDGFVIDTSDQHDPRTAHFAINGGPWPIHCIKNRAGAAIHNDLEILPNDSMAHKGLSLVDDGYSGLEALIQDGKAKNLVAELPADQQTVEAALVRIAEVNKDLGKRTAILIGGLATDYCVKATVLDTLRATDRAWVDVIAIEDAMRAVNLAYDDGANAIAAMKAEGAIFMQSYDIIEGGILVDRRGER